MNAMRKWLDDADNDDSDKLDMLAWLWDNHRNYLMAKPPFNKKFLKELMIWVAIIKAKE